MEISKQRKDLRNQNAEEGKGWCILCTWWGVHSLAVVFRCVSCFWFYCCYCYLLILWLRNNGPFLQPCPSTISLPNWPTPKHLGLPSCTGPLVLLYIFSADAHTIHTLYNIYDTGHHGIKTQLNVTTTVQLWFSLAVTRQHPDLHSFLLCFIVFFSN